jgi:hypothetical protein
MDFEVDRNRAQPAAAIGVSRYSTWSARDRTRARGVFDAFLKTPTKQTPREARSVFGTRQWPQADWLPGLAEFDRIAADLKGSTRLQAQRSVYPATPHWRYSNTSRILQHFTMHLTWDGRSPQHSRQSPASPHSDHSDWSKHESRCREAVLGCWR